MTCAWSTVWPRTTSTTTSFPLPFVFWILTWTPLSSTRTLIVFDPQPDFEAPSTLPFQQTLFDEVWILT